MSKLNPLRRGVAAATVLVAALALPAYPQTAFYNEPEDLPEGEGREDAFFACVACHSFQVVARQGMSRERWDSTLTLMVERHGMWELPEDERALILDYLAEHFPATAGEGGTTRRGWVNPFAP